MYLVASDKHVNFDVFMLFSEVSSRDQLVASNQCVPPQCDNGVHVMEMK